VRSSTLLFHAFSRFALLHRSQMRIDDDDVSFQVFGQDGISSTFPVPSKVPVPAGPRRDLGHHHIQMDGGGQPDRFVPARAGIAQGLGGAAAVLGLDMNNESAGHLRLTRFSFQAGSSCSWIGPIGITVEMACL